MIIVACVVGALLVVAIVIVLIICISNNKKQDRVVRIRPPRRGHEHGITSLTFLLGQKRVSVEENFYTSWLLQPLVRVSDSEL